MNGSTPRNRSGDRQQMLLAERLRRWRAWARAIAGAHHSGRPGVTRGRAPLAMALLRRARAAAWIVRRNTFLYPFAAHSAIVVKPVLRLSLHWTRRASSFSRSFRSMPVADPVGAAPVIVRVTGTATPVDLIHRWTRRDQRMQSITLAREIVERSRRLEERVRVEKRLAARGPAPVAITEQQEAARRAGPDWWKTDPPSRGMRPVPAAPVNVDQIAETVMRRLDQRVSAWRERTGRI